MLCQTAFHFVPPAAVPCLPHTAARFIVYEESFIVLSLTSLMIPFYWRPDLRHPSRAAPAVSSVMRRARHTAQLTRRGSQGTDSIILSDQDLAYALGKEGTTRRKLAKASGCIMEYVGHIAYLSGLRSLPIPPESCTLSAHSRPTGTCHSVGPIRLWACPGGSVCGDVGAGDVGAPRVAHCKAELRASVAQARYEICATVRALHGGEGQMRRRHRRKAWGRRSLH
jgi:hypothetical protein